MSISQYDTNILEMYRAIKAGKPFINTLGTPIKDSTGLTDQAVGVITNIMDEYLLNGGSIGDPNWVKLNDILTILDAPYLGSGSYSQPTVFDNLYPPLKYLLAGGGDISAVVQGMGIPLPSILDHTNTITESLPNILNAMGLKNSFDMKYLGVVNAVETCLTQVGIMGSLLGLGREILNVINTIVKGILGLAVLGIAALLAGINSFLQPLKEAIRNLYELILGEQSAIRQLYNFLNDYALASLLAVTQDPCIRAIVNAVGSEKLKKTFNSINKIDSLDDFVPLIIQGG
ncbi:MAG: hypothetical protein QXF12_05610 [Candidatus Aenigmatarchaeota archaeon]